MMSLLVGAASGAARDAARLRLLLRCEMAARRSAACPLFLLFPEGVLVVSSDGARTTADGPWPRAALATTSFSLGPPSPPPPPKERPRVLPSCLSSVPDAYAKSKNFVQVRRRLGTTAVSTSDCSALCLPAQARPNSRAQLHHDASRASRPGCLAWPGLALQWPLPSRSTYIQSLPSLSPYPRDANTRPGRPGTTGTHLHLHLHLHLGAQMGRRSEHRGTVMPAPYCLSFRPDPKETTTQRARSGGRAPWQP